MLKFVTFLLLAVGVFGNTSLPRPWLPIKSTESGHQGRIIGGIEANPGQFPYIASLNYIGDGHACGVSILTSNWLLTAAHCCVIGNQYIYTNSIFLSRGGVNYDIAEVRVHENYNPDNYWQNDICVIRINGNIQFNGDAQQVTLAPENFVVPDGGPVVIPGWGYTTPSEPQVIPDQLRVVTQYNALSAENCASRTGVPQFAGHICAIGGPGQGVCQGDSGGPLTYNGAQVGITSFVFLPCASGWPDFFTRVPNYISWIQRNLGADAAQLSIARAEDLLK